MAEAELWKTMREAMKVYGHFERIENMVGRGRPDVNYCIDGVEGNIELKWVPQWPARADTVVPLDHYTAQQRNWIRTRSRALGRVYVLLYVERPVRFYALFQGIVTVDGLGKTWTQADIRRHAYVYGEPHFPTRAILDVIR